jgi:hypothetical protein
MVRSDAEQRRHELVALVLEEGVEPREAGRRLGLSERTVRRYLADPQVAAELRGLQDDRLRDLGRRSLDRADGALSTLVDLATSKKTPAAVRARAARSVIDVSLRLYEIGELADRVARLEAAMQDEG